MTTLNVPDLVEVAGKDTNDFRILGHALANAINTYASRVDAAQDRLRSLLRDLEDPNLTDEEKVHSSKVWVNEVLRILQSS